MALKGSFLFFGKLSAAEAYAVIDQVHADKGGMANVHISVYATPPVDAEVEQKQLNALTNVEEPILVKVRDRGPVVEHFTCSGVDIRGKDAFIAGYEQLPKLDTRFSSMLAA